jgi:hypothetical protein
MTSWFRTAIVAGGVVLTAVGLASAGMYGSTGAAVAPKADRLEVIAASSVDYVTVEVRGQGISVLSRVPLKKGN